MSEAPYLRAYKVFAHENFGGDNISIRVLLEDGKKSRRLHNDKFVEYDKTETFPTSFRISKHDAQILTDSLWDAGIRPNGAKGSAGQLVAVEKHLQDMRAISFKSLDIKHD